jgi:hypothetical protein
LPTGYLECRDRRAQNALGVRLAVVALSGARDVARVVGDTLEQQTRAEHNDRPHNEGHEELD